MATRRYLAEVLGTFVLVLLGSMSILAALGSNVSVLVVVPFGFGLALLAGIYAFGHVSGAHFNPAVTLGMWLDKRVSTTDLIGYWIAQIFGGLLGSLVLRMAVSKAQVAATITRFGDTGTGLLSEFVLTLVFVLVILAVTKKAPGVAGVVIALTLTGVHFAGIPFSGASVNPARSFGPALVGGDFSGFWVYVVAPLAGAVVAWALWKMFEADEV